MSSISPQAPLALVTLRAHSPAPARVTLVYRPLPGRIARTLLSLAVFWGALPLLMWIPPHYPWVLISFSAGALLAYRQWTGRYVVHAFAGICPRCGRALSLGADRAISLPHTLTCYHCHFEPSLEVQFEAAPPAGPEHRDAGCTGLWELRWLADDPFLVCSRCNAGCPATPDARQAADTENLRAALLAQLTREGRSIL